MTDNEIIKSSECCEREYDKKCTECSYNKYSRTGCCGALRKDTLDLIKRQKEEIERLRKGNNFKKVQIDGFKKLLKRADTIKAEAIKEFAERVKALYTDNKTYDRPNPHTSLAKLFDNIDNLVKEMVGDSQCEQKYSFLTTDM